MTARDNFQYSQESAEIHFCQVEYEKKTFFVGAYKSKIVDEKTLQKVFGGQGRIESRQGVIVYADQMNDGDLGNTILKILVPQDKSGVEVSCCIERWEDEDSVLAYLVESMLTLRVQCYDIYPLPSKKEDLNPQLFIPRI